MFIPMLDKHLPFQKNKVHNNKIRKPWITPKHIKRKNKLHKTFQNY